MDDVHFYLAVSCKMMQLQAKQTTVIKQFPLSHCYLKRRNEPRQKYVRSLEGSELLLHRSKPDHFCLELVYVLEPSLFCI